MNGKYVIPVLLFILSITLTSCRTPTTSVNMIVPGEINLKGVSKIATVDFNTVDTDEQLGVHAADKATLDIAKKCLESVFYDHPFYTVVDLDIEKYLMDQKRAVKPASKFDALIYGRIWWSTSDEYMSEYPKKFTLERWRNEKYEAGKNPLTQKPIYATARLTEEMKEVLAVVPYRTKNASLMMALSIYKLNKDGRVEKITETFDVAKHLNIIDNGTYSGERAIIQESKADSKFEGLKKNALGGVKPKGDNDKQDVSGDFKVTANMVTIPPDVESKILLVTQLTKNFNRRISPHRETIEMPIKTDDAKILELMGYSAYGSTIKYIIEHALAKGDAAAVESFYTADLDAGAELMVKKIDSNKTFSPEKLKGAVDGYIADNTDNLYNYALCEESMGNLEKALAIYRRAFKVGQDNQDLADGISRCLFALDMADKVTEESRNKTDAFRKNKLP